MTAATDRLAATLYHYTCGHGRVALGNEGTLRCAHDLADTSALGLNRWPGFFVWLTDRPEPDAAALGLTREHIRCDRTTYRYRALDTSTAVPWLDFIADQPRYATVAPLLESPGADPSAWWVSSIPVPAVYDPLTDLERVDRVMSANAALLVRAGIGLASIAGEVGA